MKRSLFLYFSSEVFLSFGLGMIQYAQPFFYASGGIDDKIIGILFSINSIFGGVAALFLGSLADRVGASRMFKLATLILGLGYLGMSLSMNVVVWAIMSSVTGLGGALLLSTENVVLSSLTEGYEKAGILSKFVAWYMFLMGSGVVVSGYVSTILGFQHTMLLGAAIALIAPLIRVFVKAPDKKATRMFRMPSRRIVAMSFYGLLFGVATGLFNPFVTLVLKDNFHLSTHMTAIVSALSTFTVSLSSFMVSGLLRLFKQGPTLMISYGLSIVTTTLLALMGNGWEFVALYLGRTAVSSVPGSIVDAAFLNLTHATDFAQMFGVRVFGTNVGMGMGSYTGGALLNHHNLGLLLLVSAFVFGVAYVYLIGLFRKLKVGKASIVPVQDGSLSNNM